MEGKRLLHSKQHMQCVKVKCLRRVKRVAKCGPISSKVAEELMGKLSTKWQTHQTDKPIKGHQRLRAILGLWAGRESWQRCFSAGDPAWKIRGNEAKTGASLRNKLDNNDIKPLMNSTKYEAQCWSHCSPETVTVLGVVYILQMWQNTSVLKSSLQPLFYFK